MISLQTEQANIFSLQGKRVTSIVGIFSKAGRHQGEPIFFWMRLSDGAGHRFFLDFATLYWKEFTEVDESEMVHDPLIEHRELVPEPMDLERVAFRQVGKYAVLELKFSQEFSLRLIQNRQDDKCRLERVA